MDIGKARSKEMGNTRIGGMNALCDFIKVGTPKAGHCPTEGTRRRMDPPQRKYL
jgi:hypothetical protein